jgi:multicomponent Na+:H+ antiporter subunit B
MSGAINFALLAFLVTTAVAIVRQRNLFAAAILASVFSFLSAGLFLTLDAVDVAFTEAVVGAGFYTVLILGTLALTRWREKPPVHRRWLPLWIVLTTGAALIYGTMDMPRLGDPDAPAQRHVAPYYIAHTKSDIGVDNIVTAILASYRGFDTLGETAVVFTAGVGVLLLLSRGRGRRTRRGKTETP